MTNSSDENKKHAYRLNRVTLTESSRLAPVLNEFSEADWKAFDAIVSKSRAAYEEKMVNIEIIDGMLKDSGVNVDEFMNLTRLRAVPKRKAKVIYEIIVQGKKTRHKGIGRLPDVMREYVDNGGELKDLIVED